MSSTEGREVMANDLSPTDVGADNIEASRVSGTDVYDTEGNHLGQIHDIVLGKRDGQVRYAVMSFGGFLGLGESYHPLPWAILKYDERQGGYVIGVTIDQLKGAPAYGTSATPSWADVGRDVDDYWKPAVR